MNKSDACTELFAALAKAQGAMGHAIKDATNPHFRSDYATLASVWEACREPLSKNGLAVIQALEKAETGWTVLTTLTHASGQWISSSCPITTKEASMQQLGSAITYARRYSLMAIVGIAPADDDAEGAEGRAGGNGKLKPLKQDEVEFV